MNKEQMVVNAIRILSAEAVQKAKSGHPGMPMGAAAMAYAVWGTRDEPQPRRSQVGSTATASCFPPATARC